MEARQIVITRECYCGCGGRTSKRSLFLAGHDRKAETAVIQVEYGGVAEFLVAHGYGLPGGKNAMEELAKLRERERAEVR